MSFDPNTIIAENTKTILAEITDTNGINAEKVANVFSELAYEVARLGALVDLIGGQVFPAEDGE